MWKVSIKLIDFFFVFREVVNGVVLIWIGFSVLRFNYCWLMFGVWRLLDSFYDLQSGFLLWATFTNQNFSKWLRKIHEKCLKTFQSLSGSSKSCATWKNSLRIKNFIIFSTASTKKPQKSSNLFSENLAPNSNSQKSVSCQNSIKKSQSRLIGIITFPPI